MAPESVTPSQQDPPSLTTLELTFCDANGRPLSFRDAVARDGEDRWSLRAGARVALRCDGAAPRSLGGMPGGWPRYCRGQSPKPFGFDADLVVMFWDARERRGKPASTKVLRALLGPDWKAELRRVRDEWFRRAAS